MLGFAAKQGEVWMRQLFYACAALTALAGCASPPAPAKALPTAFAAGWKGEAVCELLYENDDLRAGKCTFPPSVGHERHFHPPHWGYILQGTTMRITDETGTAERELPTGATWWSDGVAWHEAVNIGETESVYLIIEPKH